MFIPLVSSLKSISNAASVIVVLVGCLVLLGWMLDIAVLRSFHPDLATMKAVVTGNVPLPAFGGFQ